MPLATCSKVAFTPSTRRGTEQGSGWISSLPTSIFEKSRISSISVRSEPLDSRAADSMSRWSKLSLLYESSSSMPMIAFIGVRISWLMVATKALFASDPARAASRDWRSSSSARLRSVMSRRWAVKSGSPPARMTVMATSTGNSSPPRRTPVSSMRWPMT